MSLQQGHKQWWGGLQPAESTSHQFRPTLLFTLLLSSLGCASAQSDLPPEIILLARIRHQASVDLSHLPRFTCLETIHRSSGRPPKPLKNLDTLQLEVAHAESRELYSWPGEERFEQRPLADMLGAGYSSTGEYIVDARNVLIGRWARIRYAGSEEIRGRKAARYDFEISAAFSGATLTVSYQSANIGERGSFWADPSSFQLLRLAFSGTDIPDALGVRSTFTQIDYGRVRIGESDILLPQMAISSITQANGEKTQNDIEFSGCRQFSAESVLALDESPTVTDIAPLPVREVVLPAGYDLFVRLETPIRLSSAKVGDALQAVLDHDLKVVDKLLVPKGAVVSGRLRLLQKQHEVFTVGMEWTDLTFGNHHAKFIAALISADPRFATDRLQTKSLSGNFVLTETPPEMKGVGTFLVNPGRTDLPRGMRMRWKILGAGR